MLHRKELTFLNRPHAEACLSAVCAACGSYLAESGIQVNQDQSNFIVVLEVHTSGIEAVNWFMQGFFLGYSTRGLPTIH